MCEFKSCTFCFYKADWFYGTIRHRCCANGWLRQRSLALQRHLLTLRTREQLRACSYRLQKPQESEADRLQAPPQTGHHTGLQRRSSTPLAKGTGSDAGHRTTQASTTATSHWCGPNPVVASRVISSFRYIVIYADVFLNTTVFLWHPIVCVHLSVCMFEAGLCLCQIWRILTLSPLPTHSRWGFFKYVIWLTAQQTVLRTAYMLGKKKTPSPNSFFLLLFEISTQWGMSIARKTIIQLSFSSQTKCLIQDSYSVLNPRAVFMMFLKESGLCLNIAGSKC